MSASQSIVDLTAKVLSAKSELLQIKRAQQAETKQQAVVEKRRRAHLDVATTIMTLQDGRLEASLCYCAHKSLDVEKAKSWLEDTLLQRPLEELVARLHDQGPRNKRLITCAQAFLQEWDLAAWVRRCNDKDGLAPLYENVYSKKMARCRSTTSDLLQARATQRSSKIQWVRRFKRRWNGSVGTVKKQNGLSEEDLRKQAAAA